MFHCALFFFNHQVFFISCQTKRGSLEKCNENVDHDDVLEEHVDSLKKR